MATQASAKKQIIDSIKDSTNILVAVSNSPSVDELSAALGLTIFLNKLGKHATAVASGTMPPAINFLEPDKTFESSANSLRDFIIALDKEKADHLRYKLEGDVVKIFITPYRTTITSDDLEFSQGDYNVELVLALNVAKNDDLDVALSAHGKILHDATVATITTGSLKSSFGSIDWHETDVSGVSEMASEIAESLKTAKVAIDEQIATALLTGIVASTERFSNDLTSSRTMTAAASLMAAGANQQLIATKLQESSAHEVVGDDSGSAPVRSDGSTSMTEGASTKLSDIEEVVANRKVDQSAADGSVGVMTIDHSQDERLEDAARQVMERSQEEAARVASEELDKLAHAAPPKQNIPSPQADASHVGFDVAPTPSNIMDDLRQATDSVAPAAVEPSIALPHTPRQPIVETPRPADSVGVGGDYYPSIGGTLNATTDQAASDKRREIERDQNRTILKHGKPMSEQQPAYMGSPLNAAMSAESQPDMVDIFAGPPPQHSGLVSEDASSAIANALLEDPVPQPAAPVVTERQSAMAAVDAAFAAQPVVDSQPVMSHSVPPVAPQAAASPTLAEIEANVAMGLPGNRSDAHIASILPPAPPMPDFGSLPPMPPVATGIDISGLPQVPTVAPVSGDQQFNPSQFQIPS